MGVEFIFTDGSSLRLNYSDDPLRVAEIDFGCVVARALDEQHWIKVGRHLINLDKVKYMRLYEEDQ